MKTGCMAACGVALLAATALAHQDSSPEVSKREFRDTDSLNKTLRTLVSQAPADQGTEGTAPRARVAIIGQSQGGREILAVEIGQLESAPGLPSDAPGAAERFWGATPALLVVAGLQGDRVGHTRLVVAVIESLLDLERDAFRARFGQRLIYFVPRANPDAAERFFARPARAGSGNARPLDLDRDGRLDEDPPEDLDGDGQVLMMRVEDPEHGDLIVDPDDPHLLRPADPDKGELGVYRRVPEGRDKDDDGASAEDGDEGVEIARNFPHGFPEHDLTAGRFATSEPATRALADYVLAHRNIAMVLSVDGQDTLGKLPPVGKKKESDASGGPRRRFPRMRKPVTKLQAGDQELWKAVREAWQKTGLESRSGELPSGGSFHEWLYFQRGLPAFAVNPFQVDVQQKQDEKKNQKNQKKQKKQKEDDEADDAPASSDGKESGAKESGAKESGEEADSEAGKEAATLLKEQQKQWEESVRSGAFVEWKEFSHPQLGEVEIGGWRPFARTVPPVELADAAAPALEGFLTELTERFADVSIEQFEVKRLAAGLYELKLQVLNNGRFPTATQQAVITRTVPPLIVLLDVAKDQLLQGERRHLIDRLEAESGARWFRWVVRAEPGKRLRLYVAPPHTQPTVKEVVLP